MSENLISWLLGGSLGSVITFLYHYKENKRKSHFEAITNQRIKWSEEIKGLIADFISFIECYEKTKDKIEIKRKMTLLELNLNPMKDEFDEEYVIKMNELYDAVVKCEDIDKKLSEFKSLSKRMVKIEWDGIKLEAKYGDLSKEEKIKLRKKWLV